MDHNSKQHLHDWQYLCARTITSLSEELSMRQWAVIAHIYLHDVPHTITSLAYTFDLPKPSICRVIDALAIKGFVARKPDKTDRRQITIKKTLKGIAFLNEFVDILNSHHSARMQPVAQQHPAHALA